MEDVAEASTAARPPGGLARGIIAETPDQIVRIGDGRAVGKVDMFTQWGESGCGCPRTLSRGGFRIGPAKLLNGAFTRNCAARVALGTGAPACHEGAMAERPKTDARSGGSLLAISIIAGSIGGTIGGQPSVGVLVGVAAGLVMLAAVWLTDRRRRGR